MKQLWLIGPLLLMLFGFSGQGYAAELTPELEQVVADLKQDLDRIRQEIEHGTKDEAAYSGGLIKNLIVMRLEILKTNEALVEQRIHALESDARITLVVKATKSNPTMATELAKEIESQRAKVEEARAEAARYSGGLIQAMAETAVATNLNTLAMLEQQYFVAKYGLAIPAVAAAQPAPIEIGPKTTSALNSAAPTTGTRSRPGAGECLKIETFDSSVLSTNNTFTELAWKIDISNSCTEDFNVVATFAIYDKDDFELDSDFENVYVAAGGTGKARGKMLVNPPEKARRMTKQGASLSLR